MKRILKIFWKGLQKYRSITYLSFALHNRLVLLVYGEMKKPYTTFHIDLDFSRKIQQHLDSLGEVRIFNNPSRQKIGNSHSSLNKFAGLYEMMNTHFRYLDVRKHEILDQLLTDISPACREFCGSPFIFVSASAWKTKPNVPVLDRGPTRMHRDGYAPGHFKCIVYVMALNKDRGLFKIETELISSENPGLAVVFRNSDVSHMAIAGEKYERYTLDLTMMRTLKQCDQLRHYPGTCDDRHLALPHYAYFT